MRASATIIMNTFIQVVKVVLPSQMRASATNTTIQTPSINIGCPTLSDEGVCNIDNDLETAFLKLSYPLR